MLADFVAGGVRTIAGVCPRHLDGNAFEGVNVYFANHSSHLDFLVIWAALPSYQRKQCVPVAAKDYWEKGFLRRYLSQRVFRALLIDRSQVSLKNNPIRRMTEALQAGDSFIIFPEGTRSLDGEMKRFKSGLYHLAKQNPGVQFVPVGLDNLNRILPKGELLPVPFLSAVTFGRPMSLAEGESKAAFLTRAYEAVKELSNHDD